MVETISVYWKFRFQNAPGLSSDRPMKICSDMLLYKLAIFTTLSDAVPCFAKTKIIHTQLPDSMCSCTAPEDSHKDVLPLIGLFW